MFLSHDGPVESLELSMQHSLLQMTKQSVTTKTTSVQEILLSSVLGKSYFTFSSFRLG